MSRPPTRSSSRSRSANFRFRNRAFPPTSPAGFRLQDDGTADADQLGAEVRARGSGRDRLLVDGRCTRAAEIVPNYAAIDRDDRIPFWRKLGERVHEHDCRFIVQLAHAGRQRDIPGFELDVEPGLSTDEPLRRAARLPVPQGDDAGDPGAPGGVRPGREARARAGLDGVEIHGGANGYSSRSSSRPRSTSARTSTEARSRTGRGCCSRPCEAIRARGRRRLPPPGEDQRDRARQRPHAVGEEGQHDRGLRAGREVARGGRRRRDPRLRGSTFPHPDNPGRGPSAKDVVATYDAMLSSGTKTFRNYLVFRTWPIYRVLRVAREPAARAASRRRASTTRGESRKRCRSR